MLSELEVLKDLCERLDQAAIPYMLTGSVAMNYYAQPRMTRDIDLVVALGPNDSAKLRQAFKPEYYVPSEELERALSSEGMFNLVHIDSVIKIDFIVRKNTEYRKAEFDRRRQIALSGFNTWIVSKEDLILSKLFWTKDSRSELQLRDVRNLLRDGADLEYLRGWAQSLGVANLLEECLHEH